VSPTIGDAAPVGADSACHEHGAEAGCLRRPVDRWTPGLGPHHVKVFALDFPDYRDGPGFAAKRTVLSRIGCQFMKNERVVACSPTSNPGPSRFTAA